MKYYGIDITQHKEYCLSADICDGKFQCESKTMISCLPAAILPENRNESVVMSSDNEINSHNRILLQRRGLGLLWPPDAQIPVNGNWNNGIGRVPLLSCISNIKAAGNADEWKLIESKTSWKPESKQELHFSNAELLARLFNKLDDAEQSCFVVPEEFGESAQQTLLEEFPENTLLIPRSIALAVKWCKDHNNDYKDMFFPIGKTVRIGHLLCASLGFGEWEVSLIEIIAERHNGEVFLMPVYDPNMRNHGLEFCGMALCSQFKNDEGFSDEIWRLLCSSSYVDYLLNNEVDPGIQERVFQVLQDPVKAELPFPKLKIMEELHRKHTLKENIISKINKSLELQYKQIPDSRNLKLIGVAAGGSFAKFPIQIRGNNYTHEINPADKHLYRMELSKLKQLASLDNYKAKRILQYRLQQDAQKQKTTIAAYLFKSAISDSTQLAVYGGSVFATGAAIVSYCIGHDLPSYQIKLLPLYLYSIARNTQGDKIEKWECLVDDKTIKAGETYKQPYPIDSLSIPEGKEHLELTLRRPDSRGNEMYRGVTAKIPQKTDRKEPVHITAHVRPGQGFAKVQILSCKQGVFSTQLDWRTMREVEKPELLLEYIPNVAFIVSQHDIWASAREVLKRFIENESKRNWDLICDDVTDILRVLRITRWEKNTSIYRYVGAISSDGILNGTQDEKLLLQFQKSLCHAWKNCPNQKQKNRLLRVSGWLYLFIPTEMQKSVMAEIKWNNDKSFLLSVAGLTFHTDEHFCLFYETLCNKYDPNAEWFRALRNIVRFRDNALSKDVLTDSQLQKILDHIIYNFEYASPKRNPRKYNNSIEVLTYLLKRRRYDENFLAAGDENTLKLREYLKNIMHFHPTEKYRKIAQQTLAFLNKEATTENLTAILESTQDEENDED